MEISYWWAGAGYGVAGCDKFSLSFAVFRVGNPCAGGRFGEGDK